MKNVKFIGSLLLCLCFFAVDGRSDTVNVYAFLSCNNTGTVDGYASASMTYGVVEMWAVMDGGGNSTEYSGVEKWYWDSKTLSLQFEYDMGYTLQVCAWGDEGSGVDFRCDYDFCLTPIQPTSFKSQFRNFIKK